MSENPLLLDHSMESIDQVKQEHQNHPARFRADPNLRPGLNRPTISPWIPANQHPIGSYPDRLGPREHGDVAHLKDTPRSSAIACKSLLVLPPASTVNLVMKGRSPGGIRHTTWLGRLYALSEFT